MTEVASPAVSDGALAALQQWRQQQIDGGRLRPGVVKDTHLQQILRSNRRTAEEIEPMLPRQAKPFVDDVVAVLSAAPTAATTRASEPTAPAAPTPVTEPVPGSEHVVSLRTADFCEFLHADSDHPVGAVTISTEPTGGHLLEWEPMPAQAGQTVLYRVVSGENHRAYKPEAGRLVGVTRGTLLVDTEPPAAAVRHLQIWCHVGRDDRDAVRRQPILIAEGHILSPVTDVVVMEDEGAVIGQWRAWPTVSTVRVLRIPLDGSVRVDNDQRHRILADQANLGGFVDRDARRGQRYLYRAICEVEVDGHTRLSAVAQAEIAVSAVLEEVEDLHVTTHGDSDNLRFDLQWTPPGIGAVMLYRTESAPRAGLDGAVLAADALELSGGLPGSARLVHPAVAGEDGTNRMTDVSWPRGWVRAYFTPVTALDGQVQVGRTFIATRPLPPLRDVRIVERCSEQVLTFPWPEGAASVSVYLSAPEISAEHAIEQRPMAEISRSTYDRDGGLHLPELLPPRGCSVHVVPVAYTAGERIVGIPATVEYPGLLRIEYRLETKRSPTGNAATAVIRLASELELPTAPPFVVVFNAGRLPLSARDGEPLEVRGDGQTTAGARSFHPRGLRKEFGQPWTADVSGRVGFLRVFADVRPETNRTLALIDPPVDQLRLLDVPPGPVE